MSLYYVQKLLFQLNRDPAVRRRYQDDLENLLADYDLTDEEVQAVRDADIGFLYVHGVNGQLLMHYAAMRGYAWDAYIGAMRAGLATHGPVKTGLYVTTDGRGAV